MCFAPQRRALFRHLNVKTVVRTPLVFYTFDLEMCFAPQRDTLFRHLNFHKWSEHGVFYPFFAWKCASRATTACSFSTSQLPKVVWQWRALSILTWKRASRHNGVHFSTFQLPKVVRTWCVLYILTWKRALRHSGVQFFISHLASWLRTRRFSEQDTVGNFDPALCTPGVTVTCSLHMYYTRRKGEYELFEEVLVD